MSESYDEIFDLKRAVRFNAKYAEPLGWYGSIPESAIKAHRGLSNDPVLGGKSEKESFARAVRAMQKELFKEDEEWDGLLGSGTRRAMMIRYNFVAHDERHYLHCGMRRTPSDRGQASPVLTYKHPDGYSLRSGGFKRRGRPYRVIVVHWSGTTTLGGCRRALDSKNISSHFATTHEGIIYQWKDTEVFTEHAKGGNLYSLGIDMIATPKKSRLSRLTKLGHDVSVMKNRTGRGDRECLTPDPKMLKATCELILDLCELYDIPLRSPRAGSVMGTEGAHYHDVLSKKFRYSDEGAGIVGHHHISKNKWDVAPWWELIMQGIGLS